MYGIDASAILHIEVQFIEREGILILEMCGQYFRTEKEQVLGKINGKAKEEIDKSKGKNDVDGHGKANYPGLWQAKNLFS